MGWDAEACCKSCCDPEAWPLCRTADCEGQYNPQCLMLQWLIKYLMCQEKKQAPFFSQGMSTLKNFSLLVNTLQCLGADELLLYAAVEDANLLIWITINFPIFLKFYMNFATFNPTLKCEIMKILKQQFKILYFKFFRKPGFDFLQNLSACGHDAFSWS